MKTTAATVLTLAAKHLNNGASMASSAALCYEDAQSCFRQGDRFNARARAIDSLRYSVGIFHADYIKAVA